MSDKTPNLTPFDTLTFNSRLQMMKALIPYMHTSQQKLFSIFIKYSEMRNTLNLFQEDENKLSACSVHAPNDSPMDILKDIRNYCSDKDQESIDLAINFYNAMQMYSKYKDAMNESGGEPGNPFDQLKMFLSPEQQEMFDTYSNMFNNQGGIL